MAFANHHPNNTSNHTHSSRLPQPIVNHANRQHQQQQQQQSFNQGQTQHHQHYNNHRSLNAQPTSSSGASSVSSNAPQSQSTRVASFIHSPTGASGANTSPYYGQHAPVQHSPHHQPKQPQSVTPKKVNTFANTFANANNHGQVNNVMKSNMTNNPTNTNVSSSNKMQHHNNAKTSDQQSHGDANAKPISSPPRFEAFIMTGDHIVNLSNKSSERDLKLSNHQRYQNKWYNKTTPNLMTNTSNGTNRDMNKGSTGVTSNSLPSTPVGQHSIASGSASVGDSSVMSVSDDASHAARKDIKDDSLAAGLDGNQETAGQTHSGRRKHLNHSNSQEDKQTQTWRANNNNNARQTSTPLKFSNSKSEEHITSIANMIVVDFDSITDKNSNSLDTLLNDDDQQSHSTSSPDHEYDQNSNHEYVVNDDCEPLCTPTSYSLNEDNSSSSATNDSSCKSTSNSQDQTHSNSPRGKNGKSYPYSQTDQTESSMNENYSVVSNIPEGQPFGHNHGRPSSQKHQKRDKMTIPSQNTLSFMSSIDNSSSSSSSTTSPTSPDRLNKGLDCGDHDNGSSTTLDADVAYSSLKDNSKTPERTPSNSPSKTSRATSTHAYKTQTHQQLQTDPQPHSQTTNVFRNTNNTYSNSQSHSHQSQQQSISHSLSSPSDEEVSDVDAFDSFHYSPPRSVDAPSANRLAKRLYHLEGFKKSDVSRHLSKNNDFAKIVAEEYLRFFDFSGDTLDVALRKFLTRFCLIGETQERERVLVHFSRRYLECNDGSFKSSDAVHTLTCALMLLNSDLHGENIGQKMSCSEFIENLTHLNEGDNFPRETLKQLFQSIKSERLEWAEDEDDLIHTDSHHNNPRNVNHSSNSSNQGLGSSSIGHNPFLEVPNPSCATEYKKGYIMRKSCFEPGGKKTPFGKRGWRMFYATLRDLVLYLHKDEQGFRKNQLYESLNNSVRVHHSLASKATDYAKKQFVFRLETADQAEYLFQTSDGRELESWVDTINLVAASLSAPPLPGAVGSNTKKFQRPLLPCSHTRLNLRDQLIDHEKRISSLERELEEHSSRVQGKSSSRRYLSDFSERENFILYELNRYRTYVTNLHQKIAQYGVGNNLTMTNTSNASGGSMTCHNNALICSNPTLLTVAIGEESGDNDETSDNNIPPITAVKRTHSSDRYSYMQAVHAKSNHVKS